MWKIRQKYDSASLHSKLVISYALLALIPLLLFSLAGGIVLVAQMEKRSMESAQQLTKQISASLDVHIHAYEQMVNYIKYRVVSSGILDEDERNSSRIQRGEGMLRDLSLAHPEIAGILVAGADDFSISNGMSRISRDPYHQESWYQAAVAADERAVLISNVVGRNIVTDQTYSADQVFSIAQALKDEEGTVLGVILVDIRHDIIMNSIEEAKVGSNGFVFVADKQYQVVYTPVNPVVYRIDPAWFSSQEQQAFVANIQGEKYQICSTSSPMTGWKTVAVYSLRELTRDLTSLIVLLIFLVSVTCWVVVRVAVRTAGSLTRPIAKLGSLMHEAENGDLDVRFKAQYNDEIGELGRSFNHMIERIDVLMRRVYEEQQYKREAELRILQEQIKPHFLYNTLDTISWMARDYDAEDIVQLVDALTNMFRVGLSKGNEIITVASEMQHVSNYLYIQKIRYQDKLNYRIDTNNEINDCLVPKLILQPLVENAIYHGIKRKRGGGTIEIKGYMEQDKVVFVVQDNGAGISPQDLELLRARLAHSQEYGSQKSFGLPYIVQRLQLHYGNQAQLLVEGELNQGTKVTVSIPAQKVSSKEESHASYFNR